MPSTAIRQSFALYSGVDTNFVPGGDVPALTPRYDVIERVVTYELPAGVTLQPNTHYTTELVVAIYEDDFGFRAFDHVPLDETTTLRTSFLTSNQLKRRVPQAPDGTCYDAEATLSNCDSDGCHNSTDRRMGMDLSNANGIILTAIGQVAHQTETGPKTGTPTQNPDRFGVAMPRIDPGRPDNSYLIYKLLLSPENYRYSPGDPDPCGTSHPLLPVGEDCVSVLATPEENERLQSWFLRGVGMPRVRPDSEPSYLVRRQLRGLESWIRAGAGCP